MISKKFKFLVLVACVGLLLIAYAHDPTKITRGLLLREEFFDNRPTSYWREIIRADMEDGNLKQETFNRLDLSYSYATPVLRQCMEDSNPNVRRASLLLFNMNAELREITPVATRFLDDPDLGTKIAAMHVLGSRGYESFHAVPRLAELTTNPNELISLSAHNALWEINSHKAVEVGNWKEFASKEWEFSVMFPGVPEEKVSTVDTLYGPAPLRRFSASYGMAVCIVGIAEYSPRLAEEFAEEERYEIGAEQAAAGLDGSLLEYFEVEHGGLRGRDWTIEVAGSAKLYNRVFLIGNRMYHANITFPDNKTSPKAAKYFLDSFQVNYRPTD